MQTKHQTFWEELARELEEARETHLLRSLRPVDSGGGWLVFADNDYLGLAHHPRLVKAFRDAVEKYGVGARASRLISGTTEVHTLLEKKLAGFKKKEAALFYGSGYLANLGILSALAGRNDLIVMDKLNHASIIDAGRLSGAKLRVYPHKNLKRLESILQASDSFRRRLIVTDSVFSMDGDLAPLRELVNLKEKYDATLMIDEAHGTGVFGKTGRGVAEHFEVEEAVDITMGTLSKAVGVFGGYVAGSKILVDYLVNFSRPFIFATAPPPAVAAACLEGLKVMEEEPNLRQKLWDNVRRVREVLSKLEFEIGQTESPIIPLMIGSEEKALKISQLLLEKGIFIPAIRYPTVARGKARLRLTLSARHRPSDLDRLFTALRKMKEWL